MEEKIQELLRIAKQNGTQATTILLEIEQLLNGDNEELQELLEKAKQNGTQATTVLLEIEQLLNGDDEELQGLLEKAKQNGTQATTVLIEIAEINSSKPKPIPVEGDVQIFADPGCTKYANELAEPINTLYVRINNPWVGLNSEWSVGSATANSFRAYAPNSNVPSDPYGFSVYIDFGDDNGNKPYSAGEVIKVTTGEEVRVIGSDYAVIFSKP